MTLGSLTTSCGVPLAMMWPWLKTRTRRARVRITSITCSTMTRVMPKRWISRTRSMARWISTGVRPASASSSSMRRGSVASTRAISRRLRPGVPRLRARCPACAPRPVISMIRVALARAVERCGWRRKAPTMTFSSTVMSSKVAGTWKVRPIPSRAWCAADALVTSTPSKTMRPSLGRRSPAMQLKKVDLPAPLGPMRPTISPLSTWRSAPATALKLPKALATFSALSSTAVLWAAVEARRQAVPQLQEPARLEAGDQHDNRAIYNVGEARAAAAKPGIGGGLQRHQDDRAQERPEQGPGAAQRRRDDELHRDEDAEPAIGIDEAGLERIERAGERGEGRAQHQRVELVAPDRHAEAARRALAGANGAQVISQPAHLHVPGDEQQQHQHAEEDVVVGHGAAEGEVPPVHRHRRALEADGGAEQVGIADDDADELGDRDRRHAEIMALQPEGRRADHQREHEAHGDAERHADERRQLPLLKDEQRQIGAGAEEHGVRDRDLAGIAADDVPCRGADRREQDQGAHVLQEGGAAGAGDEPGIKQRHRAEREPEPAHHAVPKRPCGRSHSNATKRA